MQLAMPLALAVLLVGLAAPPALAQQPSDKAKEEAALLKKAEAFVEAFHNGDAKVLATFWTPDGEYLDQTGRHFKGPNAILKAFTNFFAENKGLKLRIDSTALRFVTPEVAIEDGATAVIPPDGGPPSRARYTIVHVKRDGQWYLASVRESAFVPPTNAEHLHELAWAIGDWVDETDKGEVARVSFAWAENQGFLVSTFGTTIKNIPVGGGTQWIGWDPLAKHIRSWTFDTEGGFGEGSWTRDGNKWLIKTNSVLQDGTKVAATSIVTRIDADTISWQSRDRTVDGKPVPDIKEVRMKRVK
jgi:uncharacterized protein (TIGR02246 family)